MAGVEGEDEGVYLPVARISWPSTPRSPHKSHMATYDTILNSNLGNEHVGRGLKRGNRSHVWPLAGLGLTTRGRSLIFL